MKIRSIIQRKPNGTDVTMDGQTYKFRPIDPTDPGSPHVATITDKAHISRFLSTPEGFEYFGDDEPQRAPVGDSDADTKAKAEAEAAEAAAVAEFEAKAKAVDADAKAAAEAESEEKAAGEDALAHLLNDPAIVSRETAELAFTFLFERKPNSQAHTDTIIKKVIEQAAKDDWLADGDDGSTLIAAVEAAYADQ